VGVVEVLKVVDPSMSEAAGVTQLLTEYVARLDGAHERASSAEPFDDSEILRLTKDMIQACVPALVRGLGGSLDSRESIGSQIDRLAETIRQHPERFADDAPLVVLERKAAGLNQVLRDVDYLREGIGPAKSGHKPGDMKSDNASMAESRAITTLRRITSQMKPEGADIRRVVPEVDVDLAAARRHIIHLLAEDLSPTDYMNRVIDRAESDSGIGGWLPFRDLPYEGEVELRSSFFTDVIHREPPEWQLVGFYVAVTYSSRHGSTVADLNLMGSDSHEPGDEEWAARLSYAPRDSYARSEVLARVYELAYLPGGLGNAADYTLCLAWAAYFSRSCARRYLTDVGSDFVGLRVGFSGGDAIDLGWVRLP
jgi:hypothetical protein